MNILFFGAGVIGTTYAWQLHESGHDVSLLVRKHRLVRHNHSGVSINYTDLRSQGTPHGQTVFRAKTIDRLDPRKPFDLIVVSVKNSQLGDAIPYIAKFSGNAHILFMGNIWDEFKLVNHHFPKGRCFYAYPDKVAGSYTENGINCYLFEKAHTLIGEVDVKTSQRVQEVSDMMESAGMNPRTTDKITDWIQHRYLISAILPGLISKSGGATLFATSNTLIGQYLAALREGQKVCRKRGVRPVNLFPFNRFYLPRILLAYLVRRSFTPHYLAALDAQMKHGPEDKKKQYRDVLHTGKRLKIPMPYWSSFEKYMDFS